MAASSHEGDEVARPYHHGQLREALIAVSMERAEEGGPPVGGRGMMVLMETSTSAAAALGRSPLLCPRLLCSACAVFFMCGV